MQAVTGALIGKVLGGQVLTRRPDLRRGAGHDVRRVPRARRPDLRAAQDAGTAFLVVAAPEPDALREAAYFVERLDEEQMPLAGLVLNRVHASRRPG